MTSRWRQPLNQVIEANVTVRRRVVSARQAGCEEGRTVSVVFFPKIHSPVYQKTDKCKLGDIRQNTRLATFWKALLHAKQGRTGKRPRLEETEMRLSAMWGPEQNGALVGKLVKLSLRFHPKRCATFLVSINTPQSRKVSLLGKLGGGTLHYLSNSSANLKLFRNEKI